MTAQKCREQKTKNDLKSHFSAIWVPSFPILGRGPFSILQLKFFPVVGFGPFPTRVCLEMLASLSLCRVVQRVLTKDPTRLLTELWQCSRAWVRTGLVVQFHLVL